MRQGVTCTFFVHCVNSQLFFHSYDCGYFMLKFIEYWDGKTMPIIDQADMLNIRIKLMSTMLYYKTNLACYMTSSA
jgi:Ulp1 family protease